MLRATAVLKTPGLLLQRFDQPAGAHQDPPEERARGCSLNIVERGGFELRQGRRWWELSQGTLFVSRPRVAYRFRHSDTEPSDVCLSIVYVGALGGEAARVLDSAASARTVAPPSNRLGYLRLRLLQQAARRGDFLDVETLGGELLVAVADRAVGSPRLFRESQLRWYAERVEAARERLEQDYAELHSLVSLAASVGMSPFHFARVFRELTALPPHRYLLRVRLERARERLHAGSSVTEACFATGFSNLSHFIRSFRRAYGVLPSKVQGNSTPEK